MSDLLRIERKIDMIMEALQAQGILLPSTHLPQLKEMQNDICPLCGQNIKVTLDIANEGINRTCGCQSPVQVVPGISSLLEGPENVRTIPRPESEPVPPDEEEGTPSNSGRSDLPSHGHR